MLILNRTPGGRVFVEFGGKTVIVDVLSVNGRNVRLGFEAEKDVTILREEVYERNARASDGRQSDERPEQ